MCNSSNTSHILLPEPSDSEPRPISLYNHSQVNLSQTLLGPMLPCIFDTSWFLSSRDKSCRCSRCPWPPRPSRSFWAYPPQKDLTTVASVHRIYSQSSDQKLPLHNSRLYFKIHFMYFCFLTSMSFRWCPNPAFVRICAFSGEAPPAKKISPWLQVMSDKRPPSQVSRCKGLEVPTTWISPLVSCQCFIDGKMFKWKNNQPGSSNSPSLKNGGLVFCPTFLGRLWLWHLFWALIVRMIMYDCGEPQKLQESKNL